MSWADIARQVFALAGHDPGRVTGVSTEEYFANGQARLRRDRGNSALDLAKIEATGYAPVDASETLAEYLQPETSTTL